MTDLQKFLDAVREDSDLRNTLSNVTDIDELTSKAVILGAERGLVFSEEDALNYITQRQTEVNAELDDIELDHVVGGYKGSPPPPLRTVP